MYCIYPAAKSEVTLGLEFCVILPALIHTTPLGLSSLLNMIYCFHEVRQDLCGRLRQRKLDVMDKRVSIS